VVDGMVYRVAKMHVDAFWLQYLAGQSEEADHSKRKASPPTAGEPRTRHSCVTVGVALGFFGPPK